MKTQIVPKCGICGQDAHNHSENKKAGFFIVEYPIPIKRYLN